MDRTYTRKDLLEALPAFTRWKWEGTLEGIGSALEADTLAAQFALVSDLYERLGDDFDRHRARRAEHYPELGSLPSEQRSRWLRSARTVRSAAEAHSIASQFMVMSLLYALHAESMRSGAAA